MSILEKIFGIKKAAKDYDPAENVNPGKDKQISSATANPPDNGAEYQVHNFKARELRDMMGAAGDIDTVNRRNKTNKAEAEATKYVRDLANY